MHYACLRQSSHENFDILCAFLHAFGLELTSLITLLAVVNTSRSAMAERPRDACSAILRGWVNLRLNFRMLTIWRPVT